VLDAFFASLNAEVIHEDISNKGQVDLPARNLVQADWAQLG